MTTRTIALPLFRLASVAQIILGILFWTGRALNLTQAHMGVGMLFVVLYLILVGTAKLDPAKLALAVLLGLIVPVFGMLHPRLLVGDLHWIIRVTHLVLGIAAMAVVDRTNKALLKATA